VKEFTLEDTEGDVVWNGFDQNDKAVASGVYSIDYKETPFHRPER